MIELNSDNAFVGAKVYKNDNVFYVYKVNTKSIYIGSKKWEDIKDRQGKLKWTDFMKKVGGEKTTYYDFYITEAEAARKDGFVEKEKKQKRYLTQLAEVELRETYNKRVVGKSNKTYKYILEYGKGKRCVILEAHKNGSFLISMMNGKNYFFYNVIDDTYTDLNLKTHKKGIIEWPYIDQEIKKVS